MNRGSNPCRGATCFGTLSTNRLYRLVHAESLKMHKHGGFLRGRQVSVSIDLARIRSLGANSGERLWWCLFGCLLFHGNSGCWPTSLDLTDRSLTPEAVPFSPEHMGPGQSIVPDATRVETGGRKVKQYSFRHVLRQAWPLICLIILAADPSATEHQAITCVVCRPLGHWLDGVMGSSERFR